MKAALKIIVLLAGLAISSTSHIAYACTSDFSCRMGEACVKAPYKTRGTCMSTVNQFGKKTYQRPSTNSVYSGDPDGQCRFSTDCPIGFKCDRRLKACVK